MRSLQLGLVLGVRVRPSVRPSVPLMQEKREAQSISAGKAGKGAGIGIGRLDAGGGPKAAGRACAPTARIWHA